MKRQFIAKLEVNRKEHVVIIEDNRYGFLPDIFSFDQLMNISKIELYSTIQATMIENELNDKLEPLPLIEGQMAFATGVTYKWSEDKISLTSENDVYKKLYTTERPMFFLKGLKHTLAGNNDYICIRPNVEINIPEGELVAVFNSSGEIIGFTLGNDQTALSLEKENPLYQLQAKFFHHSASLLSLILIADEMPQLNITTEVFRGSKKIVDLKYLTSNFNRDLATIGRYLFESKVFEAGVFLFLGCGTSYPKEMALLAGDIVQISADAFPIPLVNKCQNLS